ncbi:MAG TPA: transcriptional initiation protein Tat, partial [Myxococcaceae bacterium]
MTLSRRALLRSAGLSLLGLATLPPFLARAAEALPPNRRKVLVTLFLRGGADGLSLVPPVGDPDYYRLRPQLALAAPGTSSDAALRLDDTFGLHPG